MGKQTGKIDVLVTLPVVIIRLGGGQKVGRNSSATYEENSRQSSYLEPTL
jgi:hypothetical protein